MHNRCPAAPRPPLADLNDIFEGKFRRNRGKHCTWSASLPGYFSTRFQTASPLLGRRCLPRRASVNKISRCSRPSETLKTRASFAAFRGFNGVASSRRSNFYRAPGRSGLPRFDGFTIPANIPVKGISVISVIRLTKISTKPNRVGFIRFYRIAKHSMILGDSK